MTSSSISRVPLTFGTDGWRDIIGDKFTSDNVARAAQAYADYLLAHDQTDVLVGFDTRFNGQFFAERTAQVLAANGLNVQVSPSFLPTPMLSHATKARGAAGAVMLTASHNPPAYLGFKLKGGYGGTATSDIYEAVAERANSIDASAAKPFDSRQHYVGVLDAQAAYFDALGGLVDVAGLKQASGSMAHDAMGGAGCGVMSALWAHFGLQLDLLALRNDPNPMFYGVNPEPLPQNLQTTQQYMAGEGKGALFASVTDGDADRLGVVLPGGDFFNSHQIFAVLLDMLSKKGLTGKVVKTVTTSRIVERLAKARGLEVVEVPVGFKYIVSAMLEGNVLIGGEESGGIGVKGHIPERDGFANTLLLLEYVTQSGRGLAEIFADIERETDWQHAYDRLDLHLTGNDLKDAVLASLESPPDTLAGRAVESVERIDGVKLNLSDNAWLLFRASGTEPVLRVYCEAPNPAEVQQILAAAHDFVKQHG